jgi:hypothetical protein
MFDQKLCQKEDSIQMIANELERTKTQLQSKTKEVNFSTFFNLLEFI